MSAAGRIVVIGDVIDDIVVVPGGPIRVDTDTPSSISFRAGGSAANTAAWLGSLGASVTFVGRVGALDVARHDLALSHFGVRPVLAADAARPTGTIVILVDDQHRSMLTERGANAALSVLDAVPELDGAGSLHLTAHSLFGGGAGASTRADDFAALVAEAHARGIEVSLDPGSAGFLADYGVDDFLRVVAGVDILFPSIDEGRLLTGLTDPPEVLDALLALFPTVALTVGAGGVLVGTRGGSDASGVREPEIVHVAAPQATVIDPTGAGDAFSAGFLAEWMRARDLGTAPSGASLAAAATEGVRIAALAVAIVGGRPAPAGSEN